MTGFLFSCAADNDLYRAFGGVDHRPPRFDDPAEAIAAAESGTAVLVLADGYPERRTSFPPELITAATAKGLAVLVEYPEALPGLEAEPATAVLERVVIDDPRLGPKLGLLAAHACHYLPCRQPETLLWLAHVAGYDTAVFGLPESAQSLLYRLPESSILVATSQLSRFDRARYEPHQGWIALWQGILEVLQPGADEIVLTGSAEVTPRYGRDQPLPGDAGTAAVAAYQEWLRRSRMLLTHDQERAVRELMSGGEAVDLDRLPAGAGDGSWGVAEGYESSIQVDGRQRVRLALRADCVAETAMALTLPGEAGPGGDEIARSLIDYLRGPSGLCGGERADPEHPAYGLIGWGTGSKPWEIANYGDDNARVILAWLLTGAALDEPAWHEQLLTAITANFRTTGRTGFRGDRVDLPELSVNGWRHYYDGSMINLSSHFEGYLWACYQWAYQATGYRPFLERTRRGLITMMEAFPGGWRRNDVTELSRILLPLAWQLRIDPSDQVRDWLIAVVEALLRDQDRSGGIPEVEAGGGIALFRVARTNEEYGTTEEPIIFATGDPASDQLYSTGFALLGLHEAAAVVDDHRLREGADRLADYLVRIQTRSDRPELDGAWFRSFDFDRWAYWGSSGDAGWGAWCLELGWAPAWAAAALSFRDRGTTMWDELAKIRLDPARAHSVITTLLPS